MSLLTSSSVLLHLPSCCVTCSSLQMYSSPGISQIMTIPSWINASYQSRGCSSRAPHSLLKGIVCFWQVKYTLSSASLIDTRPPVVLPALLSKYVEAPEIFGEIHEMAERKKSVVPGALIPGRYSFTVRSNYFTVHDSFASIGEDLAQSLTQVLLLVSEVVMLAGSAASSVLFFLADIVKILSKAVTPLLHIGLTLCHLLWLMVLSIIILLKYSLGMLEAPSLAWNTQTSPQNNKDEKQIFLTKDGHTLTDPRRYLTDWSAAPTNGFLNGQQYIGKDKSYFFT
ncbi:uncharacterized protein LOC121401373 [Xenopus laevis]|uniref:Uncharacterized protein LOC121401373 n=1 Tax=Xenopus laevis TaxID=8355 RepID=A0A8J1MLC9_XENLA|nr:uncharacterized protein LOC121401373 [Xenopus laevis]OCT58172.1 hypothetical protein XELAEV_18002501mg [Xenopus laevis]